ncbi:MAG: DUF1772 domain-containing protein [Alphaproteobacteria bacterium]|nr:DUF1772 domain-containing protein [Alphaproteobacteria bacterium]MCW5739052.1 DUF1772 domain-containing protein [Alphaproteobacteria bacterium]
MVLRIATAVALVLTALALAPAAAHLFSLANKIDMPRDEYFVAQGVYRGWAWLGAVLFAAVGADVAAGLIASDRRQDGRFAFAAAILLALSVAIFFVWTWPTNRATANWTMIPDNWRALRAQWEYSHAASAAVNAAALCGITIFAVTRRPTATA